MTKLTLASPAFKAEPYDLNLDYYHGKDIVHEGSLLVLDPAIAWDKISSNTRKNIRRAQRLTNLRVDRVKGTKEDIKTFRAMWFDPEDPTIPPELEPNEIMYLAYLDDVAVAGVILTPAGKNLFLHNLGGNELAKKNSVTSFLLWNAVEDLKDSEYGYIDIGASFRKSLQTYFGHWRTEKYPIIFEPPFIKPMITLTPFSAQNMVNYHNEPPSDAKALEQYFGKTFTILPRAIYAIKALLIHLDLKPTDNVAIYKTFNDNDFISTCVTGTIESRCKWGRKINAKTKAVMVIHEYGYPYKDLIKLKAECKKRGIPLIENCAWAYGSKVDGKEIGTVGDYAIYSLSKFLPIAYGAVLKGLAISDEQNWDDFKMLDYFKREIVTRQLIEHMPKLAEQQAQRVKNWHALEKLFGLSGYPPLTKLEDNVYPTVFPIKVDSYQAMFEKYGAYGVETGRYYHEEALLLPIHQALDTPQMEYIYAIYHGYLNLCSEYRRES